MLVTDTHRTKLEYSPSTQLYPEVDIQPDGTILSVYSSRQMDPVDLIRADAEIDRARRAALRVLAESQTLSIDDVALFTNRIEAAFPYNCEHVVPQSWFAKRHPMKGDLHHLFACEVKCNEFRANTPYFDFTPDGNPRAGCGRSEPGRFEPVGGKGAVARATLYFLLRYPGEIDNNSREVHARAAGGPLELAPGEACQPARASSEPRDSAEAGQPQSAHRSSRVGRARRLVTRLALKAP